jgi:hypothetical protein
MMSLKERIKALVELGARLRQPDEFMQAVMVQTASNNAWLTLENQEKALSEIVENFLQPQKLENWLADYTIVEDKTPKVVALVLAGNIPMVGFHDMACVFLSGNKSYIKFSDKDPYLLPHIIGVLKEIDARTTAYFSWADGFMKGMDAVIATGSNNSARYFEAYFSKYPHIIRKNRNAVAVLTGNETREELRILGDDIFSYFGLGCRNVSKLFLPKNYNFHPLLEELHTFNSLVLNNGYKNNFDYHFALMILNKVKYESNGCILMCETNEIASPISVVFYEFYENLESVQANLSENAEKIQLVVAQEAVHNTLETKDLSIFKFGDAQKPNLNDYADGVDTMIFLTEL